MTRPRPTLAATIAALTLTHPDYGVLHTDEEADVAEVLRLVDAEHQGGDEPDAPDSATWGRCGACRQPWPCSTWVDADVLGVLYLGRAADRVAARARATMARTAVAVVPPQV